MIEIVIKPDQKQDFGNFGKIDPEKASEQQFVDYLLKTGMWPFFKSIPFNSMADPEQRPKDIFIVTNDFEPLCPDLDYVLAGKEEKLQKGVKLLRLLTRGNIVVSKCKTSKTGPNWNAVDDVRVVEIQPTYPAGHPSVLSYHAFPLRRNDCSWSINAQDLLALVDLAESGKWNPARIMTVAGSLAKRRRYVETYLGSSVQHILNVDVYEGEKTYLSGGVFSGIETQEDGYLGFASTSLQVMPTGSQREFLRFVWPGLDKYSFSRTFLSALFPQEEYKMTTSFQGEDRELVFNVATASRFVRSRLNHNSYSSQLWHPISMRPKGLVLKIVQNAVFAHTYVRRKLISQGS